MLPSATSTLSSQWKPAGLLGHGRVFRPHPDRAREAPARTSKGGLATVKEVDSSQAPCQGQGQGRKDKLRSSIPLGPVIAIPDPNDTKKTTGTARAQVRGRLPKLGDKAPYRPALAAWLTSTRNRYFARPMVNRSGRILRPRLRQSAGGHEGQEPAVAPGACCKLLSQRIRDDRLRPQTADPGHAATPTPISGPAGRCRTTRTTSSYSATCRSRCWASDQLLTSSGGDQSPPAVRRRRWRRRQGQGQGRRWQEAAGAASSTTRELEDDPTEFTYGIPQMLKLMNTNLTNSSAEAASRIVRSSGQQPGQEHRRHLT